MNLTVSMIQFDILFGSPKENYVKVKELINKAMKSNPDVIMLPELWTTGYDLTRLDEIADYKGETTISFIGSLAKQYRVTIVAGSIAKKESDKEIYNTMFVFNPNGKVVHQYSKVHLFRLMNEEKYLLAGNEKGSFAIGNVPSAGLICYDIRFPEWVRVHTINNGAKLLFVTAEWPKPRIDHWRNLLISRAIENQCYVLACNRVGKDPDNEFGGNSLVIDPWGQVLAEGSTEEAIITTTIDTNLVDEIRKRIPIFEDRRVDLY
ncbi:carbon-nitrogen family hydrolase [Aquibacillus albus]|uniref:Amidohydrolase n=1 Tax=Aquibacillus albus TaxID=1168171 RepID=A0ABS2N2E9_9BACI|nr:carbon-nitrogen family hydrolase [Aquibacillus albus]MBM7572323.1 putative amidohydrolase [Aquibacillus albus]